MKTEEQRIAIAEACGWRLVEAPSEAWSNASLQPEPKTWWAICGHLQLPDYLNDLNAIAEAEKVITEDPAENYIKFGQYLHCLERLVVSDKGVRVDDEDSWSGYIAFATAAQRAEAFLKTLGKWKD